VWVGGGGRGGGVVTGGAWGGGGGGFVLGILISRGRGEQLDYRERGGEVGGGKVTDFH